MWTAKVTADRLASSVIAVPPMARNAQGVLCRHNNEKIIRWIEAGGVTTFLYGGNAVFYHMRLSEYADALTIIAESAAPTSLMIPSVGPTYGIMMDQVEILKQFKFPTVMILPQKEIADEKGIATGIRKFAEAYGKPIVLYLKHDRWLSPSIVDKLVKDGLVSWIKYAVVLDQPLEDRYLREVLDVAPADIVVSGIGEQPAIIHMRDFGVGSYTSGCVCVAPRLSMEMLRAIQSKDYAQAESIREVFRPLEDLRNGIQPIRVLHHAVKAAGIADTGPMQPLLGELEAYQEQNVAVASKDLRAHS
ncbi:MAG: dihydrodipicolinate synthase family protein [Pirellula sp.]|jgi:dihydrodipicolinate synthase/N-acetylneuraminate lyase|nr:dihydrodipicolinate synthase family protein [Pirellula sp.]